MTLRVRVADDFDLLDRRSQGEPIDSLQYFPHCRPTLRVLLDPVRQLAPPLRIKQFPRNCEVLRIHIASVWMAPSDSTYYKAPLHSAAEPSGRAATPGLRDRRHPPLRVLFEYQGPGAVSEAQRAADD